MTDLAEAPATIDEKARPAYRTKLIEVALPLAEINAAAAKEKSIRHGHPSTLHLWWARRPLAACRAVLFAQLVDDPSAVPEEFPTEEAQEAERQRLFRIIENLVQWKNTTNEAVLTAARREIARSVARTAGVPGPESEGDIRRILREHASPVLDPFCGGGSIPLEAQRLGLVAHASDLNPVAVLITKALIEIPPKFAGMPPVNPVNRNRLVADTDLRGARGLAEDVRYYGKWMRDEAERRIGHLYPKVRVPKERGGGEATVIAWLWARTVACPNPACGATMPLVRSFALSTKKGKETWVEPIVDREAKKVRFDIRSGTGKPPEGTVNRRGARCIVCETPVPFDWIRAEGKAGRMGLDMMAIVAEGERGRTYLPPDDEHLSTALAASPEWSPSTDMPHNPFSVRPPLYGFYTYADVFTSRQLVALATYADLVAEARDRVLADACKAGLSKGDPLRDGGSGAVGYADAVATYLGLGLSRMSDISNSLCRWETSKTQVRNLFGRQAIPMVWDFAEPNVFANSAGDFLVSLGNLSRALETVPTAVEGIAVQADAARLDIDVPMLVSTDPPYYDNIDYADLSDFFYVWLRRTLRGVFPDLFQTILVPKTEELVATPYRFGGDKQRAQRFFEEGLGKAFRRMYNAEARAYPLTLYYAFKQSESERDGEATASTGWETMLAGLLRAGFSVSGTWPMRSELANRMMAADMNALASSIVLVCRQRDRSAPITSRAQFVRELKRELPAGIKALQHGSIAGVDLRQAAIGPGMAVFSRYSRVVEANGETMTVRTALQLINAVLGEVLDEQTADFDADTRWAIAWFKDHGLDLGPFGDAETLFKAMDTSLGGLKAAEIVWSERGTVRLLRRDELPPNWNPRHDTRLTVWEVAQHLIRALQTDGEDAAAKLLSEVDGLGETARELLYTLFLVSETKGLTEEALAYDSLIAAWPRLTQLAAREGPGQPVLFTGSEAT